ncbi:MAG: TolC family protein [Acidobacteriaceae bacterium]|nr:TolC family protein [Acidobacteriaceae bacterium]
MTRTGSAAIHIAVIVSTAFPQQPAPVRMTVAQAVDRALHNFPSIQASTEQVNAALAGIRLARTYYLPSLDALAQFNRATRNNVFGLLLPQTVIPNISGPVLGTNNGSTAWGSTVGVLVSWEPFDFGRRRALVESAEATRSRAERTAQRTEFEVATATAAAFLTLLAGEQTLKAAQAAVDRAQVLVTSVKALVTAQLRPGADLSRADTELDAAETQRMQAERSVDIARATLAEYTGIALKIAELQPAALLGDAPERMAQPAAVANHPAAREQKAVIGESEARLAILGHTYRPIFNLQFAGFARGTGALTNGAALGGVNGLAPTYFNAAAGVTIDFPLLSFPSLRAQESQEAAIERSASATHRQVIIELEAQRSSAEASLAQARNIAAETPKEVADARTGLEQANAQYRSGLATIVAVAEAHRLLTQAEIDDSLAKLAVWRALLELESAQGDITHFLQEASK